MSKMKAIMTNLETQTMSKAKLIVDNFEVQTMSSSFSTKSPDGPDGEQRALAIEEARSEARFAKVNARRKLDLVCEDIENEDKESQQKARKKRKTKVGNQAVTMNIFGEDMDLDLVKHYGRSSQYCDRDLYRFHDPVKNVDDHGSKKDERLVYVDFKAGLFIAMKQKMVKTMISMNMPLSGEPTTDNFGTKEAEVRISFASTFKVKSKKFKTKIKVYTTKCAMDFQGCGANSDKIFW